MLHIVVKKTVLSQFISRIGNTIQGKITFNCVECNNRLFESNYHGKIIDYKYCPYCGKKIINGK